MEATRSQPEPTTPETALHYVLRGRLDLSQIGEIDTSVPLRVAAVRNNLVIQSERIDLKDRKDLKSVDFHLEFRLPGRRPCGVYLVVGRGDIREEHLPASEGAKQWIAANQWREKSAGHNPLTVDLGSVTILDQVYRDWLAFCRRYTIRGRVVCRRWFYDSIEQQWVFVDEPVPGATVEAYDVDNWWWWSFRDQIDTAVTAADGTFSMTFVWCCAPWFPRPIPWMVDPDLLRRIREILARVKLPIPLPDPPDPFQFQQYLSRLAGGASAGAPVAIGARVLASPVQAQAPASSGSALRALLPSAPELEALHIWPWWFRRDCAPDVVFRVTQPCGGEVRVIYAEANSQTRWNIPQTLNVTLEANDLACCLPRPPEPPCGDCLVFTWVSCVRTDSIGTSSGPPDLRGYAYPNSLDRPFGGGLRVRGDFGEDARPIVDFYRIEYRKDGMPPGTWIDMGAVPGMLGAFGRAFWNFGTVSFSPQIPSGPLSVDGRVVYMTRYKYERDNPGAPGGSFIWDDWDTLFIWNTENLPQGDGLYTFRLIGYRQAADGTLVDERVMPLCGAEDEDPPTPASVMVRVDNRIIGVHPLSIPSHPCGPGTVHLCTVEPDCDFVSVVKNEGAAGQVNINACDIVTIADTDTVTIHYLVTTPATVTDSHLLEYELTAHYGESNVFDALGAGTMAGDPTLQFGPTYDDALAQGASRPFWRGGRFKVTLLGSAFPASCAYLLRLRAWKRTTDGCTDPYYFHANVCELSFCVIKP